VLHTGGQAVNTEHRAQNRYFTPDQPCHWHTHVDDILGFETSGWLTPKLDLGETVSFGNTFHVPGLPYIWQDYR